MKVDGLCIHDAPHDGRCRDGLGQSWDGFHYSDPAVERWWRQWSIACRERDQARAELAALRRHVAALVSAVQAGAVADVPPTVFEVEG